LLYNIVSYYVIQQKILINALRPHIIGKYYNIKINSVNIKSAKTPSFPSGHTAQYYVLYLYFSTINPSNKNKYLLLFINGSNSRNIGGLHDYNDSVAAISLVNQIYNQSELFKKYINKNNLIKPEKTFLLNNLKFI